MEKWIDLNLKNPQAGPNEISIPLDSPYGLLQRYWHLFVVYMAALLFDTLSTIHFMVRGGIELELHPLVRFAAYNYGPVLGPFLSAFLFKLFAGLLLVFYLKRYAPYFLKTAIFTSFLGGFFNFWGDLFIP